MTPAMPTATAAGTAMPEARRALTAHRRCPSTEAKCPRLHHRAPRPPGRGREAPPRFPPKEQCGRPNPLPRMPQRQRKSHRRPCCPPPPHHLGPPASAARRLTSASPPSSLSGVPHVGGCPPRLGLHKLGDSVLRESVREAHVAAVYEPDAHVRAVAQRIRHVNVVGLLPPHLVEDLGVSLVPGGAGAGVHLQEPAHRRAQETHLAERTFDVTVLANALYRHDPLGETRALEKCLKGGLEGDSAMQACAVRLVDEPRLRGVNGDGAPLVPKCRILGTEDDRAVPVRKVRHAGGEPRADGPHLDI